jgi:hypothetical protein
MGVRWTSSRDEIDAAAGMSSIADRERASGRSLKRQGRARPTEVEGPCQWCIEEEDQTDDALKEEEAR